MRYLSAACPEIRRVVLVESSSRPVLEAAIPRLRSVFGPAVSFDLVTCLPGAPATLEDTAAIWRTQDFTKPARRADLLKQLRARKATVLAIVCSGEPIMTRWKWWLAWSVPAKVLIINENADCFWLDRANLRPLRQLMRVRSGLQGGSAARTLVRFALLPIIVVYLLLYAAVAHTRRAFHTL